MYSVKTTVSISFVIVGFFYTYWIEDNPEYKEKDWQDVNYFISKLEFLDETQLDAKLIWYELIYDIFRAFLSAVVFSIIGDLLHYGVKGISGQGNKNIYHAPGEKLHPSLQAIGWNQITDDEDGETDDDDDDDECRVLAVCTRTTGEGEENMSHDSNAFEDLLNRRGFNSPITTTTDTNVLIIGRNRRNNTKESSADDTELSEPARIVLEEPTVTQPDRVDDDKLYKNVRNDRAMTVKELSRALCGDKAHNDDDLALNKGKYNTTGKLNSTMGTYHAVNGDESALCGDKAHNDDDLTLNKGKDNTTGKLNSTMGTYHAVNDDEIDNKLGNNKPTNDEELNRTIGDDQTAEEKQFDNIMGSDQNADVEHEGTMENNEASNDVKLGRTTADDVIRAAEESYSYSSKAFKANKHKQRSATYTHLANIPDRNIAKSGRKNSFKRSSLNAYQAPTDSKSAIASSTTQPAAIVRVASESKELEKKAKDNEDSNTSLPVVSRRYPKRIASKESRVGLNLVRSISDNKRSNTKKGGSRSQFYINLNEEK